MSAGDLWTIVAILTFCGLWLVHAIPRILNILRGRGDLHIDVGVPGRVGASPPVESAEEAIPADAIPPALSRAELAQRLAELASGAPPPKRGPQAMCYSRAVPPRTATHICPRCGSRTNYSLAGSPYDPSSQRSWVVEFLCGRLDFWRSEIRKLSRGIWVAPEPDAGGGESGAPRKLVHLDCELDETAFCKTCSPRSVAPRLDLIIRYPDEPQPHVVRGVTGDDLQLLVEVLSGTFVHGLDFGAGEPLKGHLKRIREILGVQSD